MNTASPETNIVCRMCASTCTAYKQLHGRICVDGVETTLWTLAEESIAMQKSPMEEFLSTQICMRCTNRLMIAYIFNKTAVSATDVLEKACLEALFNSTDNVEVPFEMDMQGIVDILGLEEYDKSVQNSDQMPSSKGEEAPANEQCMQLANSDVQTISNVATLPDISVPEGNEAEENVAILQYNCDAPKIPVEEEQTGKSNATIGCVDEIASPCEPAIGSEPCNIEFADANSYSSAKVQTAEPGKFVQHAESKNCTHCGKSFIRDSWLEKHLLIHREKENYNCLQCKKSYCNVRTLRNHVRNQHYRHTSYPCVECGKDMKTQALYIAHMKLHRGFPFECAVCQRRFRNLGNMKRHVGTHNAGSHYKCVYCQKTFDDSDDLKEHTMDPFFKDPFMCEVCGVTMARKCIFVEHVARHKEEKKQQQQPSNQLAEIGKAQAEI